MPEGVLAYTEGNTLQQTVLSVNNFLAEINLLANSDWSKKHEAASRMYRFELQPTVAKAGELLRLIHPLAPYVGGPRADELNRVFAVVAQNAVAYRDDPNELSMQQLGTSLVEAIRHASDLVLLGSAIDGARDEASRVGKEIQQSVEARLNNAMSNLETLANTLRQEIGTASDRLKHEMEEMADELSARGKETIARTKKAVAGTLLIDAQDQFAAAQAGLNKQVALWGSLAIIFLVAFFATGVFFVKHQELPKDWTWQIAFYAGMRLVLLGGIAAIVSFCLRMLKGQIAIAQLNSHRTRVARSMPGLLEVVPEAERLTVLQSLIQTIVGVKESVLSDSNPESLLTVTEALEKLLRASKGKSD